MRSFFERTLGVELGKALAEFPVVTILGPRQSGKTTFARHERPDFSYANLEDPRYRKLAQDDPEAFFSANPRPLIIDEIQRAPELLSFIQILVDREGANGRFILTGSHQLRLAEAVAQSLAGRTAILNLLPFSIEELGAAAPSSREELLFKGFLPRVHDQDQDPGRAYRGYSQTYVERDLRALLNVKDLSRFEAFLRLMASRVGQLFSASALASEVGVSYKTIQEWVSILEASFILWKLPPYHANFGKRVVKSPKYYFVEPGLAVYLLGIDTAEQLGRDPLFGQLFENMVVMEAVKARAHRGREGRLYFFRDRNGSEVDLVLEARPSPRAFEIKSAMTYHPELMKGLERFRALAGGSSCLLYAGELEFDGELGKARNFRRTAEEFRI